MQSIKYKIMLISILITGCMNQLRVLEISGTYEGNHLMLNKKLILNPDSTYLYTIEGDMYVYPIKQEGYWKLINGCVVLRVENGAKLLKTSSTDNTHGKVCFYFYNINGKPVYDFAGNMLINKSLYAIERVKDNLYIGDLKQASAVITVISTNNLYENFKLEVEEGYINTYHLCLFAKNELQKNKWRLKWKNNKLYQERGFEYEKIK